MTDTVSTAAPELHLERTFAASPEDVFDAWTNPEVLRRWWAAGPDWEGLPAEVDLRVGGGYRLSMRDPASGATHTLRGEYTEVARPHRLAYTWAWENEADGTLGTPTSVEVEFVGREDETLVVVRHRGFADADSRDRHGHGWTACLDNLAGRVFGPGNTQSTSA
jgi:uncharacterized protein YndB with AHSA1/START domain